MKILLIIEREAPGSEVTWITDAIDEWTLDDAGMPDNVKTSLENPNFRQAWIEVPDNFFDQVWQIPTISAVVPEAPSAAAQQPGPWTSHGHAIPGVTVAGPKPADMMVARCGGPGLCRQCQRDAARFTRATAVAEVDTGR